MLRDLLKLALLSPTGMQIVGIPLQLKGDFVSIHCKVGLLLSDGDGLRLALQWMGSSSLHPCFRHWNVLKKDRAEPNIATGMSNSTAIVQASSRHGAMLSLQKQ